MKNILGTTLLSFSVSLAATGFANEQDAVQLLKPIDPNQRHSMTQSETSSELSSQSAVGVESSVSAVGTLTFFQSNGGMVLRSTNEIAVPLSDSLTVKAKKLKATVNKRGALEWIGSVDGLDDFENSIHLIIENGKIMGSIRKEGKLYRIKPAENGIQVIEAVDESLMPDDHPPEFQQTETETSQHRLSAGEPDFSTQSLATPMAAKEQIDLLVVYTPAARSKSGGINSLIDLAISETNTGYNRSNINAEVNLVHATEVNYTEYSGSSSRDLDRLAATNDGYMDNVHSLRSTYGADVVVLVSDVNGYCGQADAILASKSSAFAIVDYDCATGYYSFGHEIGHLQGARHNPENDPTNSPYAYGHGYQDPAENWRTVMAYNCNSGCTRINYWSNPNVYYQGKAMGTSNRNDNARVLNNTASMIAGFESSGGGNPGGDSYSNGNNVSIPDNSSVGGTSTISVGDSGTVSSVSVEVNIVHTYIGDLKVTLIAPNGSQYTLHNNSGGSANNINKTYNVNLGSVSKSGTWSLKVVDSARYDTGYIDSWTLTF